MNIESMIERRKLRRKVQGIAAALLPFESDGRVAVEAFQRHLAATQRAGLMNAVNMDTGYVNYLDHSQKEDVLRWTREALGDSVAFVAGAYIENHSGHGAGDVVALYRRETERIAAFGGIPILFQTARLHGKSALEKVAVYRAVCQGFPRVLAFELGPMALRDAQRPEFRIYTGNDLGINMIEYGSDYLLGLATFAPEKFAERDRLWEAGDPGYYALSDALQYLGNVAFREPVPAYKHSAAVFLHLTGRIPTDSTHPRNAKRPGWEREILEDCARRLGCCRV